MKLTNRMGCFLGCGLLLTGVVLQLVLGGIRWDSLAWPVNLVVLVLYLTALMAAHLLRNRIVFFGWLGSAQSAASALAWTAGVTVVMGLIRQYASDPFGGDGLGLHRMLSAPYFVLLYFWMTSALGLTILRCCIPLRRRRIPFLLNHLGLFVALLCGTLGAADVEQLKMQLTVGQTEDHAVDRQGRVHKLPWSVAFEQFVVAAYPPSLFVVDNSTGRLLPQHVPQQLELQDHVTDGMLCGWHVQLLEWLPEAVPVADADTACYRASHVRGACPAVRVSAAGVDGKVVTGWVSCGSYAFQGRTLPLDGAVSLFMSESVPRHFASSVTITPRRGSPFSAEIEVNRPCSADGWKIFLSSYDTNQGKWSETAVFELIRDPWLPGVHAGIWMMAAGALCLLAAFGQRKKG